MVAKKYEIFQANIIRDEKNIKAIIERNLNKHIYQLYEWKYKECPFGAAKCWLAKINGVEGVVGVASFFPRKMILRKKIVNAVVAGDIAVDEKHRVFGPALALERTILSNLTRANILFAYSVPNKASKALLLRAGYGKAGKIKKFVKLIHTEYKLKIFIKPFFLAKIISRIFDFLLKIFSEEFFLNKTSFLKSEILNFFDSSFDNLMQKTISNDKIRGYRTSSFLNWRYKTTSLKYNIFSCTYKGARIGCIVFIEESNIFHIVDMLSIDWDKKLEKLIAMFILYARTKHVDAIAVNYFGDELIEKKLRKFNFIFRKKEGSDLFVYSNDLVVKAQISNRDNWCFFMGDNDV